MIRSLPAFFALALLLICNGAFVFAVDSPDTQMLQQSVSIWPTPPTTQPDSHEVVVTQMHLGRTERSVKDVVNPRLRIFLPQRPDPNRPSCIVCPGGGYSFLSLDREGDDVAKMLTNNGIAAFVLVYRLPTGASPVTGQLPAPLQDVHRAVRLVRANAGKWNVDPERIGIMGFSAGGHVASSGATDFDAGNPADVDPAMRESSRPDFAALIYPVISMHDPIAHKGSRRNLLGNTPGAEMIDCYSADQHVTRETCPLFIVHAEDDKTVDVQNSLRMATAAATAKIPCDLILFHQGGHGFGLGINGGEPTAWPDLFIAWMRTGGMLSNSSH